MFPEGRFLEFLLAGVIALIVVGPKDLPILLRKLGQFMARVRSMAAEFRASFDEMARQSELDELRKEVEEMRKAQTADISAHLGASDVTQTFDELSQGLADVGVNMTPSGYQYLGQENMTIEASAAPPRPKPKRRVAAAPSVAPKTRAASKAPAKRAPAKTAAAKPQTKSTPKAAPKAPAKAPTVTAEKPRARKRAGTVT